MAEELNWEQLPLERFSKGSREIGIFELAELFGISAETLRKYEAKKILQPYREENGYRKYNTWDLTKLVYIRQLRQGGLPLSDIVSELERDEPSQQIQNLDRLRQKLREEIAHREKLIRWTESRRKELSQAIELGEGCALQRQGRRYCCVYMAYNTLVDKKGKDWEHLKEWMRALPFVRVCYKIDGPVEEEVSCLTLYEDELERYGLQHLVPDFVLPEQDCLVLNAVGEYSGNRATSEECAAAARERAKEQGLELAAGAIMEMVWYTQRQGVFQSHNKAIFPVKK